MLLAVLLVRTIATVVALLAAAPGQASQGMMSGVLYYCDAAWMNRTIVELCGAKYPPLGVVGSNAIARWQATYGDAASAAASRCRARLKSIGERGKTAFSLEELRESWRTETARRVTIGDESFCRGAIQEIEAGEFAEIWKR
jgi:hypothetical protein